MILVNNSIFLVKLRHFLKLGLSMVTTKGYYRLNYDLVKIVLCSVGDSKKLYKD